MIRNINDAIWTLEGPTVTFAGAPTNTRMTVVKLSNGALWIHSPIQWSAGVEEFVASQGGQLAALIAPNKYHHYWVEEWHQRYPDVPVFAEEALKKKMPSLAYAQTLTDVTPTEYETDIEQLILRGNRLFQEAIFFHKPSRTVIFTDLFINRSVEDTGLLARLFLRFEGVVYPNGGVPRLYKWSADKDVLRPKIAELKAWQPQRLLFAHGEEFETSVDELLEREFAFLD